MQLLLDTLDVGICFCSYWKKQLRLDELLKVNDQTEKDAWQLQSKAGKNPAMHSSLMLICRLFDYVYMREPLSPTAGISKVGLDGTLYDQVLDWIFALGLAPARFAKLSGYDLYFAMARGTEGAVALDMSKFFDTNYHYMVCLVRDFGFCLVDTTR